MKTRISLFDMKSVLIVVMVFFLFCVILSSCKKKDDIITPPVETPGKQKDIPWPSLADSPWPMAHHDPQSTGRSPYVALPEGKYNWSRLGYRSWGSTAIDEEGTIYYESDDTANAKVLVAVNPDSTVKWKTLIVTKQSSAIYTKNHTTILLSSSGSIYVISRDGQLYSVSKAGIVNWIFSADNLIWSRGLALGLDQTLYFVSRNGTLYALAQDGSVKWTRYVDNGFYKSSSGPPIVFSPDGGTLYVGGNNSGLYAVDTKGNILWCHTRVTNTFYDSRLVDNQGNIYTRINDTIVCISPNGTTAWSNTETSGTLGFTMDYDGNLYTFGNYPAHTRDARLISLSYDGKVRWTYLVQDYFVGELVCDKDGTVYFGSSINVTNYYAIKNDGSVKWIINHGLRVDFSASPAISSDGVLYVSSGGGGSGGDNGLFRFK